MPRTFAEAAHRLHEARRRPRPIDVGRLTYTGHDGETHARHFINITSFGIGGLVDRFVNQSGKALGGKVGFFVATLRASLAYKNALVRVRLDDGEAEERVVYSCAVANGRFFGGGMKIAPEALTDDGLFDVVTIGDISLGTVIRDSSRIYAGTHLSLPYVTCARARKLHADSASGEEVLLDMDGEQPGRLPATFEVVPGAVMVVA
jgi:diacylglycerol kinase family enzyme